jgi:CubicO group peptidase (beta-lactamase class C family)
MRLFAPVIALRRSVVWMTAICAAVPAIASAQLPSSRSVASDSQFAGSIRDARVLARAVLSNDTLPGLSIAVGIDGRIVWAEGLGWANVERRVPVTPTTRFRVASVGKTFTAAAAALLSERGRLDLDAPVRTYVPEFPEKAWPVTVRQLLGHTGGIRDYRGEAEIVSTRRCENVRQGLDTFSADSLIHAPGTRFQYSNFGYTLAGGAIQSAARVPYAEFMRREIFVHLGMQHTSPELAGQDVPDRATFYVRTPALAAAPLDDDSCVLPAGGFLSTPSDLVRFGFGLLGGRVLSPSSVQMLWTAQRLSSGPSTGYGMGWFVREVRLGADGRTTRMVGHGGSSTGAKTSLMVFPEQKMVVAVTTNVIVADVASLAARIAATFHARTPQ